MLSDIGCDDGISFGYFIDLLDHIRTGQTFFIVFQRMLFGDCLNLFDPFFMLMFFNSLIETCQHFFEISDNTAVYLNVFVDFCRIDINLENFGIFCKTAGISDDTVTEPGTDRDQQITFCYT